MMRSTLTQIFFEGAKDDGAGPGPHFITMSFSMERTRIRDQLLNALANTILNLMTNLLNADDGPLYF